MLFRLTTIITPIYRTMTRIHHRVPILYRSRPIVDTILSPLIYSPRPSWSNNHIDGIVTAVRVTWMGDVGEVGDAVDAGDERKSSTDTLPETLPDTLPETPIEPIEPIEPDDCNLDWDIDHVRKNGGL